MNYLKTSEEAARIVIANDPLLLPPPITVPTNTNIDGVWFGGGGVGGVIEAEAVGAGTGKFERILGVDCYSGSEG